MKTIAKFKILSVLLFAAFLLTSCASQASANDTTGKNGATNGSGKVPKSDAIHNYSN